MASLSLDLLITEGGEVDPIIYWAMVHRRCMRESGAVSPRALRSAVAHYSRMIDILIRDRRDNGDPSFQLGKVHGDD
jgi:hypothetical protein